MNSNNFTGYWTSCSFSRTLTSYSDIGSEFREKRNMSGKDLEKALWLGQMELKRLETWTSTGKQMAGGQDLDLNLWLFANLDHFWDVSALLIFSLLGRSNRFERSNWRTLRFYFSFFLCYLFIIVYHLSPDDLGCYNIPMIAVAQFPRNILFFMACAMGYEFCHVWFEHVNHVVLCQNLCLKCHY